MGTKLKGARRASIVVCPVLVAAGLLAWLALTTNLVVDFLAPPLYSRGYGRVASSLLVAIARIRPGTRVAFEALDQRAYCGMVAARRGQYPQDLVTREIWADYGRVAEWGDEHMTTVYVWTASMLFRSAGDGQNALAIADDALSRAPPDSELPGLVSVRIAALFYSLKHYEEVIRTFHQYVAGCPSIARTHTVRLTLESYWRVARGPEGVHRLRELARAQPGTKLAGSVQHCLSQRVYLYAAADVRRDASLTDRDARRARQVRSCLPTYACAIMSSDAASQATAAALGIQEQDVDRRLNAMRPQLNEATAARVSELRKQGKSLLESWLAVPVVAADLRGKAEPCRAAVFEAAAALREGESAVVVCESRTIALVVMAATGDWSLRPVGRRELGPLDGLQLCFDEGRLAWVEVLRENTTNPWPHLRTWRLGDRRTAHE